MWWKTETAALTRAGDRISTIYIDQAAVGRGSNGIIAYDDQGETHLPATMVACVLLGPGTRITHGAMRLLADSGAAVCWVGENGVRAYAHGVGAARSSRYLVRQAWLVSDRSRRLGVARAMYGMRFPGEDISGLTLQQLRGREGARVRRAYRLHSSRTGVPWQGRRYVAGQPFAAGDDANRLLSALNSCLYGVCHAVIAGVGASPALGFVHTGSAVSFALDVADLYKAQTTIPAAFDLAAEGLVRERDARLRFRDLVVEQNLMAIVARDVHVLLFGADWTPDGDDEARPALWDGDGEVPSGRDYSTEAVDLSTVDYSEVDNL